MNTLSVLTTCRQRPRVVLQRKGLNRAAASFTTPIDTPIVASQYCVYVHTSLKFLCCTLIGIHCTIINYHYVSLVSIQLIIIVDPPLELKLRSSLDSYRACDRFFTSRDITTHQNHLLSKQASKTKQYLTLFNVVYIVYVHSSTSQHGTCCMYNNMKHKSITLAHWQNIALFHMYKHMIDNIRAYTKLIQCTKGNA